MFPIAFGMGGPYDVAIIAGVVILLFGGSKVGGLFKSLGEGVRDFKKAANEESVPTVEEKKSNAEASSQ